MRRTVALFALSVVVVACQPASAARTEAPPAAGARGLPDRDIPLARRLIAEGALVLDVRTPDEWNEGHHEKAHLVPIDQLASRLDEIAGWNGGDRTKPVIIYCASGARAGLAKQKMLAAGFTQVSNAGGFGALR